MSRSFFVCLFLGVLVLPLNGLAGRYISSGEINSKVGVPDKDLTYEDFYITEDGFVTGYVVNNSDKARPNIRLDMWTTNMQETRILWRKSLNIGEIGPRAKYKVKEPYKADNADPSTTKVMLRMPSESNYRNK
jgi:hypothetical protein